MSGHVPRSAGKATAYLLLGLPLCGALGLDALAASAFFEGRWLQTTAVLMLLAWAALIAFTGWVGVRVWHAGRVAQALSVALALLVLAAAAWHGTAHGAEWLSLARGLDPQGQVRWQLSPDGRRVRLEGHLGVDDAARVGAALQAAPSTYLLELDLSGARRHEARSLAAVVRARGLQTRVVGVCGNACAVVFLAAPARQVMAGAALAFQREEDQAINPLVRLRTRRATAAWMRALGLPENFVFSTMGSAPGHPWRPDDVDLSMAGLTGVPGLPLDVPLPPGAGSARAEYEAALAAHPGWRLLDQRQGGLIATAAARMFAAQGTGASPDGVQIAAQRELEALLLRLLRQTGPESQGPYLELLAEQLLAAQAIGPAACPALLSGDVATRRALPAPLSQREADWMLAAARQTPPGAERRGLTPLESEVLRRSLGERAGASLRGLHGPAGATPAVRECEKARGLIREVMRLPPGERRLATRLIFEAS